MKSAVIVFPASKLIARWACVFLVIVTTPCSAAVTADGPYQFVATYIRTLDALETIRDKAEQDMKSEDTEGHLTGCIRNMESYQLELNADIPALKDIHLGGKLNDAPQQFAEFFEFKRDLYREMENNCTQMIQAPKPGVDYGALAAEAPKLTARLDYIDNSIFKLTPMVFATLVGPKPDAQGHMSHLSITRSQMNTLAQSIELGFGKKLDMHDQNYMVSAASLLHFYLVKKGYKGSDEP